VSNDDDAECRQRSLTLFVRQPIPKLIENQRDRRARGGTMAVAARDTGLLLELRAGEFASTATTRVSPRERLWASSPNSVNTKQWGYSCTCFRRLERGTFAFPSGDTADLSITTTELAMILGGVELPTARRRTRYQRPEPALT
jgi:hypothetical protein